MHYKAVVCGRNTALGIYPDMETAQVSILTQFPNSHVSYGEGDVSYREFTVGDDLDLTEVFTCTMVAMCEGPSPLLHVDAR